jgi:non-heme chloroperoxidase
MVDMTAVAVGEVRTGDGVTLRYLEAGEGEPLVIVPGWSCSAATFRDQLDGLSDRFRVIAVDMRGSGRSDKPDHGYRIARFAADLRDVITGLGLSGVNLLGHSLGCVVIWSYLDLFDPAPIARLILVDQPAVLMANPGWSKETRRQSGAPFGPDQVLAFVNKLAGEDGEKATRQLFDAMWTDESAPEVREWFNNEALLLPRGHAAELFLDGATADYRDLFPRITQPTLYVGGRVKTVGRTCQQWIVDQIPNARHVVFEPEDRGSHLMYIENPTKFNFEVAHFIEQSNT